MVGKNQLKSLKEFISQSIYSGFSCVGRQNETPSDTNTTVSLEYPVYNCGG
jgi:hypothetical protein